MQSSCSGAPDGSISSCNVDLVGADGHIQDVAFVHLHLAHVAGHRPGHVPLMQMIASSTAYHQPTDWSPQAHTGRPRGKGAGEGEGEDLSPKLVKVTVALRV